MINLKNLLTTPLQRIPKWIPVVLLVLAFIGFADATYLTVKHYQGIIPPCSINGCETVLSSNYSEIIGIPVALLGALHYFIMILSLFFYFDSKEGSRKKDISLKIALALSVLGLISALYFIAVMAFVLKALCIYCAVVDSISLIVFACSMYLVYTNYSKHHAQ